MAALLFNSSVKANLYKTPELLTRLELVDAAQPHNDHACWARAHEIFSIREELTKRGAPEATQFRPARRIQQAA